ncbi:hypothetical protein [uncultured Fibrella sp.]|uniref:hypothetical protein n=1 Tax=uncultured Fibrella sp. TaxID=1284596 RepID=UPI0035CC1A3E
MMNEDWSLDALIQKWGIERISRAIRPLFLGVDADNQIDIPSGTASDCAAKRRFELPTFVVSASVNDPEVWNSATATQQNAMLMACCEFHLDIGSLANDLNDVIELSGEDGCDLSDE